MGTKYVTWNGINRRKDDAFNSASSEPRIARLEAEIDSIVKDIGTLTGDVRQLTQAVSQLHVAVTTAAGPRRIEWGTLISAAAFILALGAATLSPLYLRVQDIQEGQQRIQNHMEKHVKLRLHPVGETRINAMEKTLKEQVERSERAIISLDENLKNESKLLNQAIKEKISSMEKQFKDVKEFGSPITRERLVYLETLAKLQEKNNRFKNVTKQNV